MVRQSHKFINISYYVACNAILVIEIIINEDFCETCGGSKALICCSFVSLSEII